MSVLRVTLTSADEVFGPPGQEIDVTVIDGKVFISVYVGSLEDLRAGRTKQFDVPPLSLEDLGAAVNAGIRGDRPTREGRSA